MNPEPRALINVYILQGLTKGLSTSYFVLLPVFYAKGLINSAAVGYIGATFIVMLIIGAIAVARSLHNLHTNTLLLIAAITEIVAGLVLLMGSSNRQNLMLVFAYGIMGVAIGLAMSAVGALSANLTTKGKRFKTFAKLWMLVDVIRIVFPVLIAGMVILAGSSGAVALVLLITALSFIFTTRLPGGSVKYQSAGLGHIRSLRSNKAFSRMLLIEFLDSFASSQLFVYLPLLLLAKGYSLSNSLLLQTFVFGGYFCGRWLIGILAEHRSGIRAIAYAEIGMMFSILLLLSVKQLWILYSLSFVFGIFARGTSPTIHALTFDSLSDGQIKQGSALHIIAGDSGSAIGQLLFGLLIAWFSVRVPFVVAVVVAGVTAIICLAGRSAVKIGDGTIQP